MVQGGKREESNEDLQVCLVGAKQRGNCETLLMTPRNEKGREGKEAVRPWIGAEESQAILMKHLAGSNFVHLSSGSTGPVEWLGLL